MHHNESAVATLPAGTLEELAGPPEALVLRGDRLPTLDALRGFALLGIIVLNIEVFAGVEGLRDVPTGLLKSAFVGWHEHLDWTIVTLKWLFFEGRMRSLFSMLFGAGVILLTERIGKAAGAERAETIYYRRNLWLLVFGLLHGSMLFYGDILEDYATMALFVLFPLRRLGARTLITMGLLLAVIGGTIGDVRGWHIQEILHKAGSLTEARQAGSAATTEQKAILIAAANEPQKAAAATAKRIQQGRMGYREGWSVRFDMLRAALVYKFGSLRVLEWLGAMIVGMGLYKTGYLTNQRPRREYVLVALAGFAVSMPLTLLGLWGLQRAGLTEAANARWMSLPYSLEVITGTLANASVLLLLLRSGRLQFFFQTLSAVGRTAFSNYILTSVVCAFLFFWGPWRLFGKLEFYQWYYVVAGVWVLNLTFSTLWLRFFAFGPLEWVWRSLTYWKHQPLRLPSAPTRAQ